MPPYYPYPPRFQKEPSLFERHPAAIGTIIGLAAIAYLWQRNSKKPRNLSGIITADTMANYAATDPATYGGESLASEYSNVPWMG